MTQPAVSDPFAGFDLSFQARVLLTGGLVVALLVVGWLARTVRIRTDPETARGRALNAGLAFGILVVAGLVALAMVSLWGGLDDLVPYLNVLRNPVRLASKAAFTLLVLGGAYVLSGVVERFIRELAEERTEISQHQIELTSRLTQVSMYVLAAVLVFQNWGIDLGGLLVGAGFLGIVVGLAARQTLGSLIAGFVLMFARPFEIGDWVQIGEREGIVTQISIVNTRVQTFDGEYVMIPNDIVGSSEIVNRTRKGRLRITLEVGVDYDTDLGHATEVATEAMRGVEDILSVPQPQVVLKRFGNSAVVLELRFWIDKPSSRRRWRAQTAVVSAVKEAFDREDIKIPFPQRELMGRTEEGGFRLSEGEAPVEMSPDGGAGDDG